MDHNIATEEFAPGFVLPPPTSKTEKKNGLPFHREV
jgi:hypothetical protein